MWYVAPEGFAGTLRGSAMDEAEFDLIREDRDGAVLIRAVGHAGEGDLPRLQGALEKAIDSDGIVVDLSSLEYLSSWGFGILVSTSETMGQRQRPIVFVRPTGKLSKLFDILQLDHILSIHETPDRALAALQGAGVEEGEATA